MKIRKCEANDRDQNHEGIKINFINPCKEEKGHVKDLRNIWDDAEEDTGEFYQVY